MNPFYRIRGWLRGTHFWTACPNCGSRLREVVQYDEPEQATPIIFCGWCRSLRPQPKHALETPDADDERRSH